MKEYRAYRETYGSVRNTNSDVVLLGFNVEPEMLAEIKRFRDKYKYKSTSQALRELIRRGLSAKV